MKHSQKFIAALAALAAVELCPSLASAKTDYAFFDRAADAVDSRDKALAEAIQHREPATLDILDKILNAEIPPEFVADIDRTPPSSWWNLQASITTVEKTEKQIRRIFGKHTKYFRAFCAQAATETSSLCSSFQYWDWRHNLHDSSP